MKKKFALLMLVGTGLLCTACGTSKAEVENTQVTEAVAETEAVTSEETESASETEAATSEETEGTSETEAVTSEETESTSKTEEATVTEEAQEKDSQEMEETTIDRIKLEEMLENTLNWMGLQYMYLENPDIKELTAAQAIPMAYNLVGQVEKDLEQDEEYNLIIPEEKLEQAMKNLFGTVYDTSEYTPAEYDMVRQGADGSLRLGQGDWGLSGPDFSVQSVEEDEASNSFIVTVNYCIYNWEEDNRSETEYVVRYYLTLNAESEYGFVITNLVGEKPAVSTEE